MNSQTRPTSGSPRPSAARGFSLDRVVEALCATNRELRFGARTSPGGQVLPSREAIAAIVADLRAVLFPAHFGDSDLSEAGVAYYVGHTLDAALFALREQVRRALRFCADCEHDADEIIREFAERLPALCALLSGDVKAAYEGDPAASSPDEAIFCYPGITAIIHHRLAHALHSLGVPLIPRILSEIAHSTTGIDIHPAARIGASFFIDHGTGVVIGETCVIGERVRLYQGVTLGAKRFPLDEAGRPIKGIPRHPIVEDDVVIYAGATILGRVTIGRGSSIGGNVWLTRSLPPGSRITQASARYDSFEDGGGI